MDYDQDKYGMLWEREDRAYHFLHRIPCRVIRKIGKKVRIAALLRNGKEREHLVTPEKLRHSPCHCFNECRVEESLKAGSETVKTVLRFSPAQVTKSFPDGAPQRESYDSDVYYFRAEKQYEEEWRKAYRCQTCGDPGCPQCAPRDSVKR